MIGTQDSLGVKPSNRYLYCVFLSPSGPYYPTGLHRADQAAHLQALPPRRAGRHRRAQDRRQLRRLAAGRRGGPRPGRLAGALPRHHRHLHRGGGRDEPLPRHPRRQAGHPDLHRHHPALGHLRVGAGARQGGAGRGDGAGADPARRLPRRAAERRHHRGRRLRHRRGGLAGGRLRLRGRHRGEGGRRRDRPGDPAGLRGGHRHPARPRPGAGGLAVQGAAPRRAGGGEASGEDEGESFKFCNLSLKNTCPYSNPSI